MSNITPEAKPPTAFRSRKARSRRGSELMEFTLVFLPLLTMICVIVDVSWAIFAQSTLQRAVRMGVRSGVTLTAADMTGGACLTPTVKGIVQQNAMGLLQGDTGLSRIKINYLQPPKSDAGGPSVDVSTQLNGNQSGNIMQITVLNYSLVPLMPRIFGLKSAVDNSPLVFTVRSADLIEPTRNPACIGTAP